MWNSDASFFKNNKTNTEQRPKKDKTKMPTKQTTIDNNDCSTTVVVVNILKSDEQIEYLLHVAENEASGRLVQGRLLKHDSPVPFNETKMIYNTNAGGKFRKRVVPLP